MVTGRSRYEDIRNLYVNHLARVWMEDSTTEATRVSVEEKVNSFAGGKLEHAGETISLLWGIANKDGAAELPEGTSSTVSSFRFYFLEDVMQQCSPCTTSPHKSRVLPIGPL